MNHSQRDGGSQRRELRSKLNELDKAVRGKADELASVNSSALSDMLKSLDDVQHTITAPREHAMDARTFASAAEAGLKATDKLVQREGHTIDEFLAALLHNHVHTDNPEQDGQEDPSAFDWNELSDRVARYFKLAPGVSCMLGPMDVQVKTRKAAQRQAKRPTGEAVRPEELQQIDEQEKQETDRNMEEMWGTLNRVERCRVVELICNHKCFAQTVENLFTLSFLVRDNRAYLCHDVDKGMIVQVVNPRQNKPAPVPTDRRPDEQLQFVLSINMHDWEDMKAAVKPGDTLMRHREPSAAAEAANAARAGKRPRQEDQAGPSGTAEGSKPRPSKARR